MTNYGGGHRVFRFCKYSHFEDEHFSYLLGSVVFRYAMQLDRKTVLIFAYSSTSEQSNKRSGTRLKTENEAGERR